MNYSTNYSMREPARGEKVKVADINYNTEIIDGVMLDNRQISIDMYDDTSTYNTDDLAGHENSSGRIAVYRCLQDNTTGAWDSTKWVQTNLADEITDIRGNAGASDLGDLNDVDLTNPTEGQVLTYDEQNDEWVNSDLPDADVTKEASGNPIEFSDGADAPLVKCTTAITGSQDLHGYDKPWVGGAGKNKFRTSISTQTIKGVTCTVNADGTIRTTGSDTEPSYIDLPLGTADLPSGSYVASGCPSGGDFASKYALWITDTGSLNKVDTGEGVSFQLSGSSTVTLHLVVRPGVSVNNMDWKTMIRPADTSSEFAPYSNICPITAYTENTTSVVGFNQWDEEWEAGTLNSQGQPQENTVDLRSKNFCIADGGTSYCYSLITTLTGMTRYVFWYDVNKNFISYYMFTSQTTTAPVNAKYFKIVAQSYLRNYASYQNNICFNISDASKNGTYEPYVGTTHTTTYPSAIYRGSEDVVKGEVENLSEVYSFTGNETIEQASGNPFVFDIVAPAPFNINIGEDIARPWSHFVGVNYKAAIYMLDGEARQFTRSGVRTYFSFCNHNLSSVSDCATWLAQQAANGTPVQLVPKKNPTTSSVTPTNLPIKSLSGYNHIESSTGEMDIEYFPAKEQPLIDLIPEASNMHTYSTEEQVVGTWVDGKDVYEKTYVFSSLPRVNDWTAFDEDCGIDTLVDYSLMYTRENGQIDNDSDELRVAYNPPTGLGDLCYYPGGVEATHITVRYTKTSSNNRSLKSAPQEETKEEQVEELKEEPTEEVKEEHEEVKEEPVEEVKEVKEEETKEEGEVNER